MKCLIRHNTDQYITQQLEQHFVVTKTNFDQLCNYNIREHVVFVDVAETDLINQLRDQGFKLVISKFYDELLDDSHGTYVQDNSLYLYSRNWFWINSAAIWTTAKLNYIRPSSVSEKFFLLLMNLHRDHRSRLFDATKQYHSQSLYSYVEHGYMLPDDAPLSTHKKGISDQHFYNPAWYSQTAFSLVAEARVQWPTKSPTARFVTEKTFKPMAFQHPMIIYGTPGILDYLHESGFETFDHVIDESYDQMADPLQRLNAIELILKDLYQQYQNGQQLFADTVSQQKILHNYYNFYDPGKLYQLWTTEIINPIAEFLNA